RTTLAAAALLLLAGCGEKAIDWNAPENFLLRERSSKVDDKVKLEYVSLVDASAKSVYDALADVEHFPDFIPGVDNVQLLSVNGNTRTVQIAQRVIGRQSNAKVEWTFYPEQLRIEFKTVVSNLSNNDGSYEITASPDGRRGRVGHRDEPVGSLALCGRERLWPDAEDQAPRPAQPRLHQRRHAEALIAHPQNPVRTLRPEQVHRRRADEAGHEGVRRSLVDGARRVHLLDAPPLQHHHAVAEGHGLGLLVGHVQGRHAEPALQCADVLPQCRTERRIDVRQRLVEEEERRMADERPGERHALSLAPGELGWTALEDRPDLHEGGHVLDPSPAGFPGHSVHAPRKLDVPAHGHVGGGGVALEDHGHVALVRREALDRPAPDADRAARERLESCGEAQQGRLAAPRRAE